MISQPQREAIETAMTFSQGAVRDLIKRSTPDSTWQLVVGLVNEIAGFDLESGSWGLPTGFEEPTVIELIPAQEAIKDCREPEGSAPQQIKTNGIPVSEMPEAPRPLVRPIQVTEQGEIQGDELKYLPGINSPWQAAFEPMAWEMLFRGMVDGERSVTVCARINQSLKPNDPNRIGEKSAVDFFSKRGNKTVAAYLQTLSAERRREWFCRSRSINEARYEKTMGVKA